MAQILHLHCRHCGAPLHDRQSAYCPPCHLYLCHRALPILLGMLMTGAPVPVRPPASVARPRPPAGRRGYEDKSVLIWE